MSKKFFKESGRGAQFSQRQSEKNIKEKKDADLTRKFFEQGDEAERSLEDIVEDGPQPFSALRGASKDDGILNANYTLTTNQAIAENYTLPGNYTNEAGSNEWNLQPLDVRRIDQGSAAGAIVGMAGNLLQTYISERGNSGLSRRIINNNYNLVPDVINAVALVMTLMKMASNLKVVGRSLPTNTIYDYSTNEPSIQTSSQPSMQPSSQPSFQPTNQPSSMPTDSVNIAVGTALMAAAAGAYHYTSPSLNITSHEDQYVGQQNAVATFAIAGLAMLALIAGTYLTHISRRSQASSIEGVADIISTYGDHGVVRRVMRDIREANIGITSYAITDDYAKEELKKIKEIFDLPQCSDLAMRRRPEDFQSGLKKLNPQTRIILSNNLLGIFDGFGEKGSDDYLRADLLATLEGRPLPSVNKGNARMVVRSGERYTNI